MSDILLILDVSSDLVDLTVCIDEGKLKQVLINLVRLFVTSYLMH